MTYESLIPLFAGAAITLIITLVQGYVSERRRLHHRWDATALQIFTDYAASARRARDETGSLGRRMGSAKNLKEEEVAKEIYNELQAVARIDFERVAVLGSQDVVSYARKILAGVNDLKEMALVEKSNRSEESKSRGARLMRDQRAYYVAVRKQLRVPSGADPGDGVDPPL